MLNYKRKKLLIFEVVVLLIYILFQCVRGRYEYNIPLQELVDSIQQDGIDYNNEQINFKIQPDVPIGSTFTLNAQKIKIPAGAYDLVVHYDSNQSLDKIKSMWDSTGEIRLSSDENAAALEGSSIVLSDSVTEQRGRFWIRSFANMEDLSLSLDYINNGGLCIKEIAIEECMLYRVTKVLVLLAVFILYNIGLYFFSDSNRKKEEKIRVMGLIAIVIFASIPLNSGFIFFGQDLGYHMTRIWSLAQGLGEKQFPVRLQSDMLNGYGYVSSLFYPEFFLYFPAILFQFGIPLFICYNVYVIGINILTVINAFYSFGKMFEDKNIGVFGAAIYTLSAYRIICVYTRASVGEYSAFAFLPLILYGFYKIYSSDEKLKFREYFSMLIGVCGVLQTHILSCEMVFIVAVIFCVLNIRKTFTGGRFLTLIKVALLSVGCNLFFLLPFVQSMKMPLYVMQQKTSKIQSEGAYLIQLLNPFFTGRGVDVGSKVGIQNEMPISLGFALVMGTAFFIFIYLLFKSEQKSAIEKKYFNVGGKLLFFGALTVYMSLSICPWDSIAAYSEKIAGILCKIQFPWRYLSLASLFLTAVTLAGIKITKNRKHKKTIMWIVSAIISVNCLTVGYYYMTFSESDQEMFHYNTGNTMDIGAGKEYLPDGTNYDALVYNNINKTERITISSYERINGKTIIELENNNRNGKIIVPVLYYDNYRAVNTNTGEELEIQKDVNNEIAVKIPSGFKGKIELYYKVPKLWRVCDVISALVFVACIAGAIFPHGRRKLKENTNV